MCTRSMLPLLSDSNWYLINRQFLRRCEKIIETMHADYLNSMVTKLFKMNCIVLCSLHINFMINNSTVVTTTLAIDQNYCGIELFPSYMHTDVITINNILKMVISLANSVQFKNSSIIVSICMRL